MRRAEPPRDDDAPPLEVRTPLARDGDPSSADPGIFGGLFAPHPASTPGERAMQVVLTAIGLPVILATLGLVGWLDLRSMILDMRRGLPGRAPLSIGHPFAWILGALAASLVAFALRRPDLETAAWGVIPLVALFVRRALVSYVERRERVLDEWKGRRR